MAAKEGNLVFLKKLSEWAKKKLTIEEINNKWLLVTNRNGIATCAHGSRGGQPVGITGTKVVG